jgi:hypothetical protein
LGKHLVLKTYGHRNLHKLNWHRHSSLSINSSQSHVETTNKNETWFGEGVAKMRSLTGKCEAWRDDGLFLFVANSLRQLHKQTTGSASTHHHFFTLHRSLNVTSQRVTPSLESTHIASHNADETLQKHSRQCTCPFSEHIRAFAIEHDIEVSRFTCQYTISSKTTRHCTHFKYINNS